MKQFPEIVLVVFLLIVSDWSSSLVHGYPNEYPNIFPISTVVNPGATVTFSCHATAPIVWTPFRGFEGFNRVTVENETNSGPHPYTSRFILTDVTYHDVGFYECGYPDDTNSDFSSFSYISVEDPENLLVPHEPHTFDFPFIGQDYVFKTCRPTSPNVEVTLTHDHHLINPTTDSSVTYDPQKGFTIIQVVTTTAGTYTCTARLGDSVQFFVIELIPQQGPSNKLPKPVINASLANSISLESTFILDCFMETPLSVYFDVNWTAPLDIIQSDRATITVEKVPPQERKRYRARLTVVRAKKSDGDRDYICTVKGQGDAKSSARHRMRVYGPDDEYLHANASDDGNITINASGDAQWVIDAHGFPAPNDYYWEGPKENELTNKGRYSINFQLNQVILTIRDVTMDDGGAYTFTVKNDRTEVTLNLFLIVRDSPKVSIENTKSVMYYAVNQVRKFTCVAEGFPYPTIEWHFQKCRSPEVSENSFSDCEDFELQQSVGREIPNVHENAPRRTIRDIWLNITDFGMLKCMAFNGVGNGTDELSVMVIPTDFTDPRGSGFDIIGTTEPIETDDVEYDCAVTRVNSTNNIKVYYVNASQPHGARIPVENVPGTTVIDTSTKWSYQKKFSIKNIQLYHRGQYICEVEHSNGEETSMERSINLSVQALKKPIINDTNLNGSTLTRNPGDKLDTFYCKASGVPAPNISWVKDGIPPSQWSSTDQIILKGGELTLGYLKSEHSGTYTCSARNKVGVDEKSITVNVEEPPPVAGISAGVILGVIMIALIIALSYYVRRERKMKMWLKKLQLDEFENGDVEKINPEEGVDAQVNLLPYDKKYEFPRDRLTLGIRLGSGAFGLVLKGEAKGIKEGESSTTVAVKMVKPNADESHFKALMSELKIMIHLEQHVNVVNLLGACTKQLVKKRELLVIVEFCKYGSLLSYVHRHCREFVDQLDRVRDVVDPMITYSPDSFCQSPPPRLNYAALTFTDSGTGDPARTSANGYHTMDQLNIEQQNPEDFRRYNGGDTGRRRENYAHSSQIQSTCTGSSFVSNSPMSDGKRRSSTNSSWNGNYHGVYNYGDAKPITTSDLLCWSFQVARGMEYLATRKILHGDLAARNVLLAEGNIVKICDFGLSREMYQEKYKKKSEGVPLPVKWMALEAIYFQVFSTQSDVWSFGVVMWELFTLGKTPYPGMEVDERFYKLLNNGYRMEKPMYAPSSIYDLMTSCWDGNPSQRPTFSCLAELLGNLIEDGVRQHYIDLNAPYNSMNERRRMEGREDYLAKMSGADYNCTSQRGTPDRSYANVPTPGPSTSGMTLPNTLGVPHSVYGQSATCDTNYQNLERFGSDDPSPPSLQRLQNNTGYYYMNKDSDSPGPTNIFSPRPHNPSPSQFDFNDSPENDASNPEQQRNSTSKDATTPRPTEVHGVSNANYLPNNIFSTAAKAGREIEDIIEEASNNISDLHHDENRDSIRSYKMRQKNDSGVSSIDSNFEVMKGSTPPLNCEEPNTTTMKQQNNSNLNNQMSPQFLAKKSQNNNVLSQHNHVPIPIISHQMDC